MLPVPDNTPDKLKSPTPAEFTPPKAMKVPAFWEMTVPDKVSVPFTLVIRVLRKVAGDSGLTADVNVPERLLFPILRMAADRSPTGPRPSKSILRANSKPAVLPSSTNAPPPMP